jgi:hypothetical protein
MSTADSNPDVLLKDINKSILTKGIVIALIAHAIIIFGTSFSLYRDWAKYGVKTPSAIKAQKKEEQIAADKAKREEEIKRKAEESAALASNAAPAQASAPAKANAPADAKAADASGNVKPPEIQPLKPVTTDDVSLDDLGL